MGSNPTLSVPTAQSRGEQGALVARVDAAHSGMRLDQFAAGAFSGTTRSEAHRLIISPADAPDGIRVNGGRERASYRVRAGDVVSLLKPPPSDAHLAAEKLPLRVVYCDEDVLVVDKPRGMVTHPAPGSASGTLVNAVLGLGLDLPAEDSPMRPGIVHRLDKDTGGLLVIARHAAALRALQAQIQARSAARRYLAVVWGSPKFETAVVDAPIGRHPVDRKRMAVVTDGRLRARAARTRLTVRERFGSQFALLEAALETGRTHQVRVHCAHIAHPLIGDPVYGGERRPPTGICDAALRAEIEAAITGLHGQALHAYSLAFDDPRTGERLTFESPLPAEIDRLLRAIRLLPRGPAKPSTRP